MLKNAYPVHVNAKQKHFESGKNCSESSRMFLQVYPIIHGQLTNINVNQKNISCSSNAMEMEGAVILFQRSIQLHRFRYTSMLGDGDSKTHTKLLGQPLRWVGNRETGVHQSCFKTDRHSSPQPCCQEKGTRAADRGKREAHRTENKGAHQLLWISHQEQSRRHCGNEDSSVG